MLSQKPVRFGVNYVPSRDWYYMWERDLRCVKEDFAAIKQAGIDHIRLQLRWDIFQKGENTFSSAATDKLVKILDYANENGLKTEIAALTGWLSGFWFLPCFINHKHIIADKEVITAEKNFFSYLAFLSAHPTFFGIDLGNEINMFAHRGSGCDFTAEQGDMWYRELSEHCKEIFKNKSVTLGADHQPWFDNKYFSKKALASHGTATALHTWVKFTGALGYGGALGAQSVRLAQMCAETADAYAENPNREINIQEFGISDLWAKPCETEPFIVKTVENALNCAAVSGFTYWCSHDVSKDFGGFDELEYGLGLFDINNKLKPQGEAYVKAINYYKKHGRPAAPDNKTAIIIDDNAQTDGKSFGWYYGEKFCKLAENNIDAAFVLKEHAGDKKHLAERNIKKVIEAADV